MSNLLQQLKKSLPSFYQDSVQDDSVIESVYSAVADLVSELYIRTMAPALNASVHTSVIDYTPDYRVISIRESQVFNTGTSWICNVDYTLKSIKTISSNRGEDSLILENGTDFKLYAAGTYSNYEEYKYLSKWLPVLEFFDNPYNWGDTGESLGSTTTKTYYSVGPYFLKKSIEASSVYDDLSSSDYIYIKNGSEVTKHEVLLVEEGDEEGLDPGIYLSVSTPAPYLGNVLCSTTAEGTEFSSSSMYLESVEYEHDDTTLYLVTRRPVVDRRYLNTIYGQLFSSSPEISSEGYRLTLIRKMMLRTLPYSSSMLHTVIGIMLGIPYIADSDEIPLNIKYLSNGDTVLETSRNTYTLSSGYILDSTLEQLTPRVNGQENQEYSGVVEFLTQYTPISKPYNIYSSSTHDYSSGWWYGSDLVLPDELLVNETESRRTIGQDVVFQNTIGTTPAEDARIGDYCIEIGQETRQRLAFSASQDFYKHKLVIIEKSNALAVSLSDSDKAEIQESAPVDTFIIFKE